LVIVVDDMGYSDLQPFGGEIRTPVLQALAEAGARFRRFYTSSLCAPARAMLLSGCDNHQVGMGVMQPMHAMNSTCGPATRDTSTKRCRRWPSCCGTTGITPTSPESGTSASRRTLALPLEGSSAATPSWGAAPVTSPMPGR